MSGRTHPEITSLFLRWAFAREMLAAWRTGRHARRGFDFFQMCMKYSGLQGEKNEWMKLEPIEPMRAALKEIYDHNCSYSPAVSELKRIARKALEETL